MNRALRFASIGPVLASVAALAACGTGPSGASGDAGSSADTDGGVGWGEGGGGSSGTFQGGGGASSPPTTVSPPASTLDGGGGTGSTSDAATGTTSGGDSGASPFASRKRGIAYGSNSDADLAAPSSLNRLVVQLVFEPRQDPAERLRLHRRRIRSDDLGWNVRPDDARDAGPGRREVPPQFSTSRTSARSRTSTPAQAAALWPTVEAFADAHNLKIVSPALNYCGGSCNETNPFTWLDAFSNT